MRRREFIAGLSGAAAWPFAAHAQSLKPVRRVGIFSGFSNPTQSQLYVEPFKRRMLELGWSEGKDIEFDYRQVSDPRLLESAAAELVSSNPEVILAMPTPAMRAIWKATRTIPVIFVNVSDPVEGGFVVSLARPGSNATGFTAFEYSVGGKWLELLKEFAPTTTRVLVLMVPENYTSRGLMQSIESAAKTLGIKVIPGPVHNVGEIQRTIEEYAQEANSGLITLPHPVTTNNNKRIFELVNAHRIPAIHPFRHYAVSGGLVAYGPLDADVYIRAASYVDRVLKGAKPADLPVQNPTKFELVINLKAARAIGLTVPSSFLIRADEVIE